MATLLLGVYSIFAIIINFKNCDVVHYKILKITKKNNSDPRSSEATNALIGEKTLNLVHSASPIRSLFMWPRFQFDTIHLNALLPSTFVSFLFFDWYSKPHRHSSFHNAVCKADVLVMRFMFRCLKPKVCVMLDDPRWTALLRLACQKENIKAMGYMHGRFNEYHVGLFGNPFDEYFVWSQYFKRMYVQHASSIGKTRFWIRGMTTNNNLDQCLAEKNVLFVDDDQTSFDLLLPFAEAVSASPNAKVFVRLKNSKAQSHKCLTFVDEHSFQGNNGNMENQPGRRWDKYLLD